MAKKTSLLSFFILLVIIFVVVNAGYIVDSYEVENNSSIVNVTYPTLLERTADYERYLNADGTMTITLYNSQNFIDDQTEATPHYVPINESFFPIVNSTYMNEYAYQLNNTFTNYSAYFKKSSKDANSVRFEKGDYFISYDISNSAFQWLGQPGNITIKKETKLIL